MIASTSLTSCRTSWITRPLRFRWALDPGSLRHQAEPSQEEPTTLKSVRRNEFEYFVPKVVCATISDMMWHVCLLLEACFATSEYNLHRWAMVGSILFPFDLPIELGLELQLSTY